MIIPVRCFTCGKVSLFLTNNPGHWQQMEQISRPHRQGGCLHRVSQHLSLPICSEALDQLGCKRYCCRRMILTHVDLIVKLLHYNIYEKAQDWLINFALTCLTKIFVKLTCALSTHFFFFLFPPWLVCRIRCPLGTLLTSLWVQQPYYGEKSWNLLVGEVSVFELDLFELALKEGDGVVVLGFPFLSDLFLVDHHCVGFFFIGSVSFLCF